MIVRLSVVTLCALTLSACGANRSKSVRRQASVDLSCSESQVHLKRIKEDRFLADGCGRRAVYGGADGTERLSAIEGAEVAP